MAFGLPPPESDPLRSRLMERINYLDDLMRGGLDDLFARDASPEVRQATRMRLAHYMQHVFRFLAALHAGRSAPIGHVLMDVPVTLVDEETGSVERFTVVGPDEIDTETGWISFLSPLGSALLLKGVGETVVLEAPGGRFTFRVVQIGPYGQ